MLRVLFPAVFAFVLAGCGLYQLNEMSKSNPREHGIYTVKTITTNPTNPTAADKITVAIEAEYVGDDSDSSFSIPFVVYVDGVQVSTGSASFTGASSGAVASGNGSSFIGTLTSDAHTVKVSLLPESWFSGTNEPKSVQVVVQ